MTFFSGRVPRTVLRLDAGTSRVQDESIDRRNRNVDDDVEERRKKINKTAAERTARHCLVSRDTSLAARDQSVKGSTSKWRLFSSAALDSRRRDEFVALMNFILGPCGVSLVVVVGKSVVHFDNKSLRKIKIMRMRVRVRETKSGGNKRCCWED